MAIFELDGEAPDLPADGRYWIADSAVVIGRVRLKTDEGEFILDNQNEEVLLWSETGYRFVKRQSQNDPNVWIALGDPRPATATAMSR